MSSGHLTGKSLWSTPHLLSRAFFLVLACIAVTGCGGKKEAHPTGSVQGKVLTPAGQPLTEGEVGFSSSEMGSAASVKIESNGTFKVPANIRAGKYVVTVRPPTPAPPGDPTKPQPPPDMTKFNETIPLKYRAEASTPLKSYEVKTGKNEFEIKLEK